jgi:hypothetical protein
MKREEKSLIAVSDVYYSRTRVSALALEHFSSASFREKVPSAIVLPAH